MRDLSKVFVLAFLSSVLGLGGCGDSSRGNSKRVSSKTNDTPIRITAQINHRLLPIFRGERYEDPLHESLQNRGLGVTTGGGTALLPSGEIEYIDVEITLRNEKVGVPFVIEELEKFGAPKGSILRVRKNGFEREIPFGKSEGIAVYLDGVGLGDEVYAKTDILVVVEEFDRRLKDRGEFQGDWQGPRETGIYLYGRNAEEMKTLIADFLAEYPLCKGARVRTITPTTPKPSSNPK